jgi:hypothetical protein
MLTGKIVLIAREASDNDVSLSGVGMKRAQPLVLFNLSPSDCGASIRASASRAMACHHRGRCLTVRKHKEVHA